MLRPRLIPCLTIDRGRLVKTTEFANPKYVGDVLNAVRIFNEKEVDELIVLDIGASRDRKPPDFALIENLASECFMPVAYGGGVRTLNDAERLFRLGIEKVCVQTQAIKERLFVSQLVGHFGSQSIQVSVDVKKSRLGKYKIFNREEKIVRELNWKTYIHHLVNEGAGEIVINNVDRDGTREGLDLELIRSVSDLPVPIVAMGGVGSLEHVRDGFRAGASAVAAGSFFVFHGKHQAVLVSYPLRHQIDDFLTSTGDPLRS
jgi:cyclase